MISLKYMHWPLKDRSNCYAIPTWLDTSRSRFCKELCICICDYPQGFAGWQKLMVQTKITKSKDYISIKTYLSEKFWSSASCHLVLNFSGFTYTIPGSTVLKHRKLNILGLERSIHSTGFWFDCAKLVDLVYWARFEWCASCIFFKRFSLGLSQVLLVLIIQH